jgi:hypothetical protein
MRRIHGARFPVKYRLQNSPHSPHSRIKRNARAGATQKRELRKSGSYAKAGATQKRELRKSGSYARAGDPEINLASLSNMV